MPTEYARGRLLFVGADAAGNAAANIDREIDKVRQDFGRMIGHLPGQVLQRQLLLQIVRFLRRAAKQFVGNEHIGRHRSSAQRAAHCDFPGGKVGHERHAMRLRLAA